MNDKTSPPGGERGGKPGLACAGANGKAYSEKSGDAVADPEARPRRTEKAERVRPLGHRLGALDATAPGWHRRLAVTPQNGTTLRSGRTKGRGNRLQS